MKLEDVITPETHPEHFCQMCGGRNLIAWYADADEWNKVVEGMWSIICPICFGDLANLKGLRPTAWRISREGDSPEVDKLRERIHELNQQLTAASHPVMEWISIDERLPEDNQFCLFYSKSGQILAMLYKNIQDIEEWFKWRFSHWIPTGNLPIPPRKH